MAKPLRVLIVEDSKDDALLITRELQRNGYDLIVEQVDTPVAMTVALERQIWDIIIADYIMPHFSGLDALKLLHGSGLDPPFIVVSGKIGEDTAVAAMKAGAHDYIMKNNLTRLAAAVERELHQAQVRREHRRAEEELTKYRQHLEELVEERTAELTKAKEQLQWEITERKRAEEELKEYSQRLEEMVEERTKELQNVQEQLVRKGKLTVLGELAGGVAHELRNPLGAIKNAAYFLNTVLEEPEPEVKETLELLEKAVVRAEHIIRSLLGFASPKPPMRRKVDINDVIQKALSRTAVPENIEVVSQLGETLPAILADPYQLGQVLENIILNAIQAMPEGGQLVVTSEVPSSEWVTVSFTDTGVGIPAENLARLFEPLFTTKAMGIGLGLAIVKTLIEGHGGTIQVQSEVKKGSTFTVRLPIDAKCEE